MNSIEVNVTLLFGFNHLDFYIPLIFIYKSCYKNICLLIGKVIGILNGVNQFNACL